MYVSTTEKLKHRAAQLQKDTLCQSMVFLACAVIIFRSKSLALSNLTTFNLLVC